MAKKNSYEVTQEFIKFLEDEGLGDKKEKIDGILSRYWGKPGGLIPVLQQVQTELRYLPPIVQEYIALGLNVPASDVFGVVSFYSFFATKPRGKYIIKVCLGTACYVQGGEKLVENFKKGLNVEEGGTTDDRMFTLDVVRCIGACGLAPVLMVNDDTHGKLKPDKVMDIAKKYQEIEAS